MVTKADCEKIRDEYAKIITGIITRYPIYQVGVCIIMTTVRVTFHIADDGCLTSYDLERFAKHGLVLTEVGPVHGDTIYVQMERKI